MSRLARLEPELAEFGGTVSVWCGRVGTPPAYARLEHAVHYPASTMKLAVLAAAYRLADAEVLDLDADVTVRQTFTSAAQGADQFQMDPDYDSDPKVWQRLDGRASLRWLSRRMIVRSSNLATNVVLEHTGYAAATDAWRVVGARHSAVNRGIEDYAARDAGLDNTVTAADLAALLAALQTDRLASADACHDMRQVLLAQEHNNDLPAGLPPGTRIAHKNGWIDGIRHDAGIVYPPDTAPYVLVVCLTTSRPDGSMRHLMSRIAAASWADRHNLTG
ncbi:MAG TPA: serine hydrolase [Micromonosporaceae bacterium]|jgi:beta-lactamase class A|nr:serine hydrolase [Micromonosporaceae bacterium]